MNHFKYALAVSASLVGLVTLSSCDEILNSMNGDEFVQCMGINGTADMISGMVDVSKDEVTCPRFQSMYEAEKANEGALISDAELSGLINSSINADYAMSLTLNATAINKLFKAANTWTYDKMGFGVPYFGIGGCDASGLDQEFTGDTTSCLTVTIEFNGVANALLRFGVPVTGEVASDLSKTSVFIDLSTMQILKISAQNGSLNAMAKTAINLAIQQFLSGYLPKVHLFDIAAWNIGNGDIKLVAGAPKVHIEQLTGYEALEFGMYTNLFAQAESINIARDMPQNAEVGLHIHPQLIRAIIARMMTEQKSSNADDTYITREVELDSSELNSSGYAKNGFHVTMTDLSRYPNERLYACSSDWRDYFTFGFRLWSTDSFCGYMDLLAGMNMVVTDRKFKIGIGNIHAGYSDGAMSVVGGALNSIASTNFAKSLLEYTNISVNFNEMSVSSSNGQDDSMKKAEMVAYMDENEHFQFSITGTGINLYLNFLDL